MADKEKIEKVDKDKIDYNTDLEYLLKIHDSFQKIFYKHSRFVLFFLKCSNIITSSFLNKMIFNYNSEL